TDSTLPTAVNRTGNWIGESHWVGDDFYEGQMDELRVSIVDRSEDWIWATWRTSGHNDSFTCYGVPTPYDFDNEPATMLTPNSANVNATLNETNAPHWVEVYWGPVNGGTNMALWSNHTVLGWFTNSGPVSFSQPVTGLTPDTTYYFAYRVTNIFGAFWASPSEVFETTFDTSLYAHDADIQFCGYDRNETLTNFPALIVLGTNVPGFAYSQLNTNATDLRFTASDRATELNYDIESWDTNGLSYVWVQVPALVDASTLIVAWWGNPAASNPPPYRSNGATWSEGYQAVYHFAGNADNAVANGNDGILIDNATTMNNGVVNGALNLDGVGDHVNLGPGFEDFSSGITVEAWARTTAYRNWSRIIDFGNGPGLDSIVLTRRGTTDDVRWEFYGTASGTEPHNIDGNPLIPLNQWQHWMATVDAGGPNAALSRFYLDGVERGRLTDFTRPSVAIRTSNLIGESNWPGDDFYEGQLDEVRISTVERSSNWVWATWQTMASNDSFTCYGVTIPFDLALTKTASSSNLLIGSNLIYTIDVMNLSTIGVSGVVVTDTLPAGVVFLSSVPPAASTNGTRYAFNLGALAGSSNAIVTVQAAVTTAVPGVVTNWAVVVTPTMEMNPVNNTDSAVTVIPDSDGDGIANPADPDDDNDGVSDEDELVANT
ncbi:MAG: DUF2341 domain-containing protein, partial [Verrucomicrobiota bacterium]